ncbi:MAG: PaaI family thioesterase [Lachnospiraceae bacterium]|nr:PaaI family thioesterase [Lachnospiraceae bacterium]
MNFDEQVKRVNETNKFMLHNGIRAVELAEDHARIEAVITEDSENAMGGVHGGLMFVMAEVAAGLVTRNDGRKYVTLDSSFRFLNGASQVERVEAEASIVKRGRTVSFSRARVYLPENGKTLAEGDFTFYCLG